MCVPYFDNATYAGTSDIPYQVVNLRIEDCGDKP